MNNIKNSFSIKDLENLSGIKAHTIRIWEKRYNVLEPERTQTNIRQYDTSSLQKLLNITLLHHHGYKISKISKYPPEKIPMLVRQIINEKSVKNHAISAFKMAMLNFDPAQFHKAYEDLLSEKSFREIFYDVFIPLITEIGLLWQSDTITPAHEHFISFLIKQKITSNIEKLQKEGPKIDDRVFVLYLPENELHELGLMFVNYELLEKGFQTIYLGESIPSDNLPTLNRYFDKITFLSYFTIEPVADEIDAYIKNVAEKALTENGEFWILGKQVAEIDRSKLSNKVKLFPSIRSMTDEINTIVP
ncbi:MerR family transcriptional regulator [Flavobacterium sp. CYK-4]|uniref:MerR family transcriptional regulator n=1 Tax=Flavobacterium lotistagni TaxID=2709660 RepID=UPI00140D8D21|nr:MerR family transcriptional regulator [Flavobacterium lotistagni]NHM07245.1 MerR family transcriptional regulator [Flavobacterium lotistagni]